METEQTQPTTTDVLPPSLQTRDARLQTACDIFNIVLPDWEIHGDPTMNLTPTHVDYDETLQSYHGRCGPRQNGRVFLRLNKEYITDTTRSIEHKLCLFIHEFAHAVDIPVNSNTSYRPTHTGDFYTAFANLAERTVKHKPDIENTLNASINWTEFLHEVTRNPKAHQIDSRSTTTHETRRELVDRLGSATPLDPFSGMTLYSQSNINTDYAEYRPITLSDLHYEHKSMEDLMEWWRTQEQKTTVKLTGTSYYVELPYVNPNGDGTYIAENDYVATVLYYALDGDDTKEFTAHVQ